MNGGYFLLRTLEKVSCEAALLCLGYNLKRVYNVLGFDELMARLCCFLYFFIPWRNLILPYNKFSTIDW